jgi:hypothetical protein
MSKKGKIMSYIQSNFMHIALCFLFTFLLQPSPALAQQKMSAEEEALYKRMVEGTGIDPDLAMEAKKQNESSRPWTEAGVIDYRIVGVYEGRANVSSESNWSAYVDVTDRVIIDLKWNLAESKLVGTPGVENTKSIVKNPRNPEPSCLPPILKGEYEHYELLGIRDGLAGALELQVQTTYPAVEVAQSCTGSRKTVPASVKTRPEEMAVPSPVMFEMPLPDSDNLRISQDKKSLIHKKAGWTWTFTPSIKK